MCKNWRIRRPLDGTLPAEQKMATPNYLHTALPDWCEPSDPARTAVIGVLTGEGVGSEVIPVTLALLEQLMTCTSRRFELRRGGDIGKSALAAHGCSLSDEVAEFCRNVFADGGAILCGPGGERFVYELRARFDLFCKFTPLRPCPALRAAGSRRHPKPSISIASAAMPCSTTCTA